jgi:hypothetical protein
MKTEYHKINQRANKFLTILIGLLFCSFSMSQAMAGLKQNTDTASFITISGKITDKETSKPLMYANVYIIGTSIGTVANADGEFLLKIPKERSKDLIGAKHLGYKAFSASIESLKNSDVNIVLEPEIVPLQEIIIRTDDPVSLIRGAIANVRKNYRRSPTMMTSFYREAIQQNHRYVSIAEAVLETYKTSYTDIFTDDKVKVLIGRKGQDVKRMDTVVVKLQGGPVTPFYLDFAKNPENLFSEDYYKYYDFALKGQISLDNERCYVIEFTQKPIENLALYKGVIYLEVQSLAIVGLEFSISDYGLPYATNLFIKKKPITMRANILGAHYYVKYAKANGFWNLNYVRSELSFKCKWKKKFFSSTYKTMVEMAVTDIDTVKVERYKSKETFKQSEIFSDKVDDFKNDEFWGDYNIIKPDESIQNAINKLSKRLKRK